MSCSRVMKNALATLPSLFNCSGNVARNFHPSRNRLDNSRHTELEGVLRLARLSSMECLFYVSIVRSRTSGHRELGSRADTLQCRRRQHIIQSVESIS